MHVYCLRQLKCRYFYFFECALTSNPVTKALLIKTVRVLKAIYFEQE